MTLFGLPRLVFVVALPLALLACGGGGGDAGVPAATPYPTTIASSAVTIPASTYAPGSAEQAGWTVLQTARVLCGFGALNQDTRLDAAALAHARYQTSESVKTGTTVLTHEETNRANAFYTGQWPWDRTAYQRYGTQVAEILQATTWDYDVANPPALPTLAQRGADSMISLLNTVYHLQGALYDGIDVGFGVDLVTTATGTSRREDYRFGSLNGYRHGTFVLGNGVLATYPCQGSVNVPRLFVPAYESPNPFPAMTSPLQTVGPPIYLKADAGQVLTLTSGSVSSAGVAVSTTWLTHANDPARDAQGNPYIGTNEAFVIPSVALSPNTQYQVALTGTIDGLAFSRTFTMTTEP